MSRSEPAPDRPRVGYVLKMYPRFSETFVVNEILAVEAGGAEVDIFSLRPPADGRFHESLAEVRASVTYLRSGAIRAADAWTGLRNALPGLPGIRDCLGELLDLPVVDALASVELAEAVRDRGLTHLHAHFGSVSTTVARLAARLAGVPYTFTAHAKDVFHDSVDTADLRRKLRDAAAVVTVSDFNLRHLRAVYGPAADRVVRVYNGLDLERFAYASPACRPRRVVAVGRLVEKKGFTDLLDALAVLARAGREVPCDLVGTGPLEPELREQAGRLGLAGQVCFLGALPSARVREVVRGGTVFAAPCVVGTDGNRDGLPTVLLEAMALGTPCVATPVTGIPEVVRDGVTGLLVPEADPVALAGALERLLDDGGLRVALASAARTLVEREFDVTAQAARLMPLFTGRRDGAGHAAMTEDAVA
jgi:colanic acid/amylovoran biosynthesis glycosyltransferase